MNFKEYFEPIDNYLIEGPQLFSRAVGRADPALVDPQTGKPYRKHNRLKQLKTIFEKAVKNNTKPEDLWGSFSCIQRLGPKYSAPNGMTPLGLYAFPVKYIIEKDVTRVPMAGKRKYLHIFKIKNHENYISMKPGEGEIKEEIHNIDDINANINQLMSNYIYKHTNLKISLLNKVVKEELSSTGNSELYSQQLVADFYHSTVGNVRNQADSLYSSKFDVKKYAHDRLERLSSKENLKKIIAESSFAASRMIINYDINLSEFGINPKTDEINKYVRLPIFGDFDIEKNYFTISEDVRNFAKKMLEVGPFSKDNDDILKRITYDVLETLSKDKITLEELVKISRGLRPYLNLGQNFRETIGSSYFHTYLQSYFLLNNKKIRRLLNYWTNKISNLEGSIEKKRKEILDKIQVPFGKELKDFCEQNDLDWGKVLIDSLNKIRSTGKVDVSGKFLYIITKKISEEIVEKKGFIDANREEKHDQETNEKKYRSWAMWTGLLRKLGIDGLLDSDNTGSIYHGEPTQGVFFTVNNIELISTMLVNRTGDCDAEEEKEKENKKEQIAFDKDTSPKERWFLGLTRNFEKIRNNLDSDFEKNLNRIFVLCFSLVRETKKLSEEEYQTFFDHGIFSDATMTSLRSSLNYILESERINGHAIVLSEETKSQITKAIELIDQLISSGIYGGNFSSIDFSKITFTKEVISKSREGVANIGQKFLKILTDIQRKIRVFSRINVRATERAREINDIIDSFKQTMIDLESVDIELSNRFDLDPHWHKTKEYNSIMYVTYEIFSYVKGLEPHFSKQPKFAKISSKIKEILNCVKFGREKVQRFWCYQVQRKIK